VQYAPIQTRAPQADSVEETLAKLPGGSGVCIGWDDSSKEALVLTAYHVVGKMDGTISLRLMGQAELRGNIIGASQADDLALISVVTTKPKMVARISKTNPDKGAAVYKAGYASSLGGLNGRWGPVWSYQNGWMYVRPVVFQPGDSGGPIFSSTGELCGIVSQSDFKDMGLGPACEPIQKLLGRVPWPRPGKPSPPPQQQPPPSSPPSNPPPAPPVDAPPSVQPPAIPPADFQKQFDELKAAIANIPAGPKGDKGDQGPRGLVGEPGAPGKDGQPGKDGKDAASGPFIFILLDENGKELSRESFGPGIPLRVQLEKVKVQGPGN
jgi:hypothetical protein